MQRSTKQRDRVTRSLELGRAFVSAQQLHAQLGDDAPSLATVYRTLQLLARDGLVDAVNRDGETLYRACGTGHHHHLVCVSCATTIEVDGNEIEEWATLTAARHGFTIDSHVADVYGRCPDCAA